MKTSKIKSILIATILSVAVVIGTSNPVSGQRSGAPVLNVEKTSINKDLTHLTATRDRVNHLQAQLNTERKAGTNTNVTKKELMKAKADKQQAQAYLKADKRDLLMDHQSYINEKKAELRRDRYALLKTSFDVKKAKSEKSTALRKTRMGINDDKLALIQAKTTRNNDLIAANAKIEDANGQNIAVLKTENTGAKLQNLAMK